MSERLDPCHLHSADGEWGEDGFHLRLVADDLDLLEGDTVDLRVTDVEVARNLIAAVDDLRSWVAEHDYQRASYERASPEEIARVIGDYDARERRRAERAA